MDTIFAARKYLKYRLRAGTSHDVHSPFVFDLFNNVINDNTPYYGFDLVESLRARHLLTEKKITVTDFGTGIKNRTEKISDIARKSVKPKKFGQLLFRLVNRFNPDSILEIGTSLGITTLYLSLPKKNNRIITLEGCPETANVARQNFNRLKQNNIEIITGEFDETIPQALKKFSKLDMVYFDGNHRKNSTLSYFNQCLPLAHDDSVFVFDDIHWSREMDSAWDEIKKNKAITLTIDLYQLGIAFFRKSMVKQDFMLLF